MSTVRSHLRSFPKAIAVAVGVAVLVTGCSYGGARDTAAAASDSAATASRSTNGAQEYECGGMTIDHSAAITSAHDLLINAPIERVWDVQTDVANWGEWQQAVSLIERLDAGPFNSNSQFRWTTPVPASQLSPADTLTITSTVKMIDPGNCVLWEGPAIGRAITIDKGTHLWTFTKVAGGTLVHTEESWDADILASLKGPDAEAAETMLGGGLKVWLESLKTKAESD